MINIRLFKFVKKKNSTLVPAAADAYITATAVFKDPTSLINPVIEFATSSSMEFVNYVYVQETNRYYWITDIIYNRGVYELRCHVDVLGTYRLSIGATSMYVTRSSLQKNGNIRDDMYPLTGAQTFVASRIDTSSIGGYKDGVYVISTIGAQNNAGQTIYQMTVSEYNNVMQQLFTQADGLNWGGLGQGVKNSLLNPLDYVVSAYWFPTAFPVVEDENHVVQKQEFRCGLWTSGVQVPVVANYQQTLQYAVTVPKHPQAATRGAYMNAAPFSRYSIDLGVAGSFELDSTKLMNISSFVLDIHPDPLTGIAKITGISSPATDHNELFNLTANYGVPLNISMVKNNLFNTITDIVGVGASIATGNGAGIAVGVLSAIGDLATAVAGTVSNTGAVGSITNHMLSKWMMARFFTAVDDDNAHKGRPLCQVTTPNALTGGYIKAENVDISIDATESELNELKALLEAGFFMEL